ncbi:MAG: hypothetical protein JNL93_07955 [Pelomonas sp.]|nr:hypothetical protein [Roseateles sp.]
MAVPFPPLPRRRLLALPLLLSARPLVAQAIEPVRMPRHISMPDPQMNYVRRLVELALNRMGSRAEVRQVELEMTQGRSLVELATGRSPIDLMWTVTDNQRESSGLLPVRIPIDRGMMGWRLLLVRQTELPKWRRVRGIVLTQQNLHRSGR